MSIAGLLLEDHAAGAVVRVFHDVFGGVDATSRHAGFAQRSEHIGHAAALCPGLDGGIEFLHAGHPASVVGQAWIVAEVFTGQKGKYVPLKETIRGFKAIIAGEYDHLPEQAFYMVGTIEEAAEKAKTLT